MVLYYNYCMNRIDDVYIITRGAFGENTYIVKYDADKCIIIDPGLEGKSLLSYVNDNNLTLTGTILTHNHFDHIAGLTKEMLHKKIYMSEIDKTDLLDINYTTLMYNTYGHLLIENQNDFNTFFDMNKQNSNNILSVKDGDTILDMFTVLFTPGHTKGSICLINDSSKTVFTGDTLFLDGYGRYDLPGGDYNTLMQSLKRLVKLPQDYIVYPGHGGKTTIQNEMELYS